MARALTADAGKRVWIFFFVPFSVIWSILKHCQSWCAAMSRFRISRNTSGIACGICSYWLHLHLLVFVARDSKTCITFHFLIGFGNLGFGSSFCFLFASREASRRYKRPYGISKRFQRLSDVCQEEQRHVTKPLNNLENECFPKENMGATLKGGGPCKITGAA